MYRILLIDVHTDILEANRSYFEEAGFSATACDSGAAAFFLLQKETFDCIVLDVMMPGMDGYEVCRKIRQKDDTPVVFLFCLDHPDDKIKGLMLGGGAYMVKPYDLRELHTQVTACIKRGEKSLPAAGLLFSVVSLFTATPSTAVETENGEADLTSLDLSRETAAVRPEHFDYYPGVYLFPGSFADAPAPRFFTRADQSAYQYGTFRVSLRLPAGKTYALRAMAVNFSQWTWIDGAEQEPVGWPGETAETTVPRPAAQVGLRIYTGFSVAYGVLVMLTKPLLYSRFLIVYQAVSVLYDLYILCRLAVRYTRTEQELVEMTELAHMKSEFLNQASHDLKTPVAAMGLSLQRLEEVKDEAQRASGFCPPQGGAGGHGPSGGQSALRGPSGRGEPALPYRPPAVGNPVRQTPG